MDDDRVVALESQRRVSEPLTELLREKAAILLQAAIEAECDELVARYRQVRDREGRRAVVRNGHLPGRSVVTGLGPVGVKVPRLRDRTGRGIRFESKLVPPYVRRAASIDAVLPWLYLRHRAGGRGPGFAGAGGERGQSVGAGHQSPQADLGGRVRPLEQERSVA